MGPEKIPRLRSQRELSLYGIEDIESAIESMRADPGPQTFSISPLGVARKLGAKNQVDIYESLYQHLKEHPEERDRLLSLFSRKAPVGVIEKGFAAEVRLYITFRSALDTARLRHDQSDAPLTREDIASADPECDYSLLRRLQNMCLAPEQFTTLFDIKDMRGKRS